MRTKCTKEGKNDYEAIAEFNKKVILEDSAPSSLAPSDKEAEFLPLATKKKFNALDKILTFTWNQEQLTIQQASA